MQTIQRKLQRASTGLVRYIDPCNQEVTSESEDDKPYFAAPDSSLSSIDSSFSSDEPDQIYSASTVGSEIHKEELQLIKQQALKKQEECFRRKQAATKIQAWYRSCSCRAYYRALYQELKLKRVFTRIRETSAALTITRAIRNFVAHRKELKSQLLKKFYAHCAVLIQKVWRGYSVRKRVAKTKNLAKEKALGLVKGWKIRRILRTESISNIVQQIKFSPESEAKLLKLELLESINLAYQGGSWIKPKKVKKPFLKKKVDKFIQPSQRKRSLSGAKPRKEAFTFFSPIPNTSNSVDHTPELTFQESKPFLKRKSERVTMQKLNWSRVPKKIDCWSKPSKPCTTPVKNNSLEEFLQLENSTFDLLYSPKVFVRPKPEKIKPIKTSELEKYFQKHTATYSKFQPQITYSRIPQLTETSKFLKGRCSFSKLKQEYQSLCNY